MIIIKHESNKSESETEQHDDDDDDNDAPVHAADEDVAKNLLLDATGGFIS